MERPCINHSLGICAGPHLILDEKEYRKKVDEACHFLSGNHVMVEKILRDEIKRKSNETKFEEALILRDKISALNSMRENQNIAGSKLRDMDILGYGCFKGKANICQMQVRNHNVIQFLNHPLLGVFKFDEGDSIKAFIKQHYSTADLIPKSIYTSGQPTNINDLIQALTDLKKTKVEIKMAQRGQIYRLVQMAVKNSLHQMMMDGLGEKEKNQTDLLKNYLKLKRIPQRIEGYDISNLGEKNTVGSMVVYQNGAMNKNEYRRFKIKGTGQNDAKNLSEMISRRLKHSEWKTPDIILLDGGKPQLNAVKDLIPKGIELISLAKKEEEIYQFGRAKPLKLKKDDRALLLLESIRDEAHRFGKKYHKLLRKKSFINQKRRPQPQIPSKESVSPTT